MQAILTPAKDKPFPVMLGKSIGVQSGQGGDGDICQFNFIRKRSLCCRSIGQEAQQIDQELHFFHNGDFNHGSVHDRLRNKG